MSQSWCAGAGGVSVRNFLNKQDHRRQRLVTSTIAISFTLSGTPSVKLPPVRNLHRLSHGLAFPLMIAISGTEPGALAGLGTSVWSGPLRTSRKLTPDGRHGHSHCAGKIYQGFFFFLKENARRNKFSGLSISFCLASNFVKKFKQQYRHMIQTNQLPVK